MFRCGQRLVAQVRAALVLPWTLVVGAGWDGVVFGRVQWETRNGWRRLFIGHPPIRVGLWPR